MTLLIIVAVASFLTGVGSYHFIGAVKLSELKAVEDNIIAQIKAKL